MLNQVDAINAQGSTLPLILADISGGYSVHSIDGLDPVPANIVSSSFARLDGEQFQSSRREKRNIILKLGLEPDYTTQTVQQLRNNLYNWFLPKKRVLQRFYTDELPDVEIDGYVESFDCPLFVPEPEATISIINHNPDFIDPVEVSLAGNTNSTGVMTAIDYDGSVDTGIVFQINIDRTLAAFQLYHQAAGEQVRTMPVEGSFLAGDVIELSTVAGDKYITLTRGGVSSSILYALSPYSDWTRFQPGANEFRVNATGAAIPYTIRYTNKYGGL